MSAVKSGMLQNAFEKLQYAIRCGLLSVRSLFSIQDIQNLFLKA